MLLVMLSFMFEKAFHVHSHEESGYVPFHEEVTLDTPSYHCPICLFTLSSFCEAEEQPEHFEKEIIFDSYVPEVRRAEKVTLTLRNLRAPPYSC